MANILNQHFDSCSLLGNDHCFKIVDIDLSITGPYAEDTLWESNIEDLVKESDTRIYKGGYLEKRFFYSNEILFGKEEDRRQIHLGVDVWIKANSKIYCPLDAIVYGIAYNDKLLDYGFTIILKHQINSYSFFSLYGHLNDSHMDKLEQGQAIKRGMNFCEVGAHEQNGGWPPHLHFQLIKDIGGSRSDYPGVSSIKDLDYYKNNCPDGSSFIF